MIAESDKFVAEQRKLMAESEKSFAERRKLMAGSQRPGMERSLAPWPALVGLIGGVVTVTSAILHVFAVIP